MSVAPEDAVMPGLANRCADTVVADTGQVGIRGPKGREGRMGVSGWRLLVCHGWLVGAPPGTHLTPCDATRVAFARAL